MSNLALIPLPQAARKEHYGAKASNLARLLKAGIPTAPGLVLGADVLQDHLRHLQIASRIEAFYTTLVEAEVMDEALHIEAASIRHTLQNSRLDPRWTDALTTAIKQGASYAVRSSAPAEDGTDASFAGQFDSILDCRSPDAVAQAVCRVWASLFSERAVAYSHYRRCRPGGMAVIIQQQVEAVVSGVMFTRDPRSAAGNTLLVEYCAGLGERLVSGQASPGRLRIDRDDGSVAVESTPDEPVMEKSALAQAWTSLRELAPRLEALFNGPQDVEWSLDTSGRLMVLQTRPITAMAT